MTSQGVLDFQHEAVQWFGFGTDRRQAQFDDFDVVEVADLGASDMETGSQAIDDRADELPLVLERLALPVQQADSQGRHVHGSRIAFGIGGGRENMHNGPR